MKIAFYLYTSDTLKGREPDYAFEADNRRTLEAFCTAFGIEVTEYVYHAYCYEYRWTGDKDIKGPELEEYVRHRLSLFEPTGRRANRW